jgi:hypothetical protein
VDACGRTVQVTSAIIAIIVAFPRFSFLFVALAMAYLWLQALYLPGRRQIKRLRALAEGRVVANMHEILNGGAVMARAFKQTDKFLKENMTRNERVQRYEYVAYYLNR